MRLAGKYLCDLEYINLTCSSNVLQDLCTKDLWAGGIFARCVHLCQFQFVSSSLGSYTNLPIDNSSQNVYPKFLNKLLLSGPIPKLTLLKPHARTFLSFPQLG